MYRENSCNQIKDKITREAIIQAFEKPELNEDEIMQIRGQIYKLSQLIYYELFEK